MLHAGGTGIHALLLAVLVLAAAFVPGFASTGNIANVVTQSAALGLVAIGQTFVIVGGLIDLSVGQLLGLTVVLTCALTDGNSAMLLPTVVAMIAAGTGVGLVHGWLVNRWRVNPLILTFGTLSILQGLIFTYTDRSIGRAPAELGWIANGRLSGLPVAGLVLLSFAVVAHVVLTRTRFDVGRIRLVAFVLSGIGAALGGLLVAGRIGTGYPNAGAGFELDAIVAVVLGGASLAGGRGSIAGTVAAALLLGVVANVLNLLEVSSFVQTFIKGLIVVFAIVAMRFRASAASPA